MRIELPTPSLNDAMPRPQDDAPTLTLPPHWVATVAVWLDAPALAGGQIETAAAGTHELTLTL